MWWTDDPEKAHRLSEHYDESAKEAIEGLMEKRQAAVAASRATDADINVPANGQAYLPFQKAGIAYVSSHEHALIGDDMGL